MLSLNFILHMFISFVVSVTTIPFFGKLAYKYGIVDKPDGDLKPHERITPYLGGLSIFIGVLFASPFEAITKVSLTILVLLGLYDDIRNLNPKVRLLVEILVSFLLVFKYSGISIFTPLYMLVIVALINAVNMMDGLDGVCASVSMAAAFGFTFVVTSQYDRILLFSLIGALLGYLIYNFPPARIFMGDAGSYLIGGILSIGLFSAMRGINISTSNVVSAYVFVSLFFFDLTAGVLRRLLNGRSPFSGDRGHIYDKINNITQDKRKTLIITMFIQLVVVSIGFLVKQSTTLSFVGIIALSVFFLGLIKWLKLLKY
ncbi:glycosyltransferase family 4 protein [Fervidobacterium sp.]